MPDAPDAPDAPEPAAPAGPAALPEPAAPAEPAPAEVLARAQQVLAAMSDEEKAGIHDLENLVVSMGLPAVRAAFRDMVDAACAQGRLSAADKAAARDEIRGFSAVTEVGCVQVDFHNCATGRPDRAYLLLAPCPRRHDFGRQIDKLKPLVAPGRWPELLRHLSVLFNTGRRVYAKVAREHLPLVRKLAGRAADDDCAALLDLQVDAANTTLYVEADWPRRAGLFVRLQSELDRAQNGRAPTPS